MRYELRPRLSLDQQVTVTECATGRVLHAERQREGTRMALAVGVAAAVAAGGIASAQRVFRSVPVAAILASLAGGMAFWTWLRPRRHIVICADELGQEPVMHLRRIGAGFLQARYDVAGPGGHSLWSIRKGVAQPGTSVWKGMDVEGRVLFEAWPAELDLSEQAAASKAVLFLLILLACFATMGPAFLLLFFAFLGFAYLARDRWLHSRYSVRDVGGASLAAFVRRGFLVPSFVLEIGDERLGPDQAIALACLLAMDPRGTG